MKEKIGQYLKIPSNIWEHNVQFVCEVALTQLFDNKTNV